VSCRTVPNPSNRWRGRNTAGYCSQPAQDAIERLQLTIDEAERTELIRDLVRIEMMMPLYWDLDPILAVSDVTGPPEPTAPTRIHTWNVAEWDRTRPS